MKVKVYYNTKKGKVCIPDSKATKSIKKAVDLINGKTGFKTDFEVWENCLMEIYLGKKSYAVTIIIRPDEKALMEKSNYVNSFAFYSQGRFVGNETLTQVELI